MMIYLGTDHRGFQLKEKIKSWLKSEGHQVEDLGNKIHDPDDDYVDFSKAVAERISGEHDSNDRGIVFCGSGVGVDVTVNRYRGVRSAFVLNEGQVEMATRDDHVNVLSVAADFIKEEQLKKIIIIWLKTGFSQEERHLRRLRKIEDINPRT